MKIRPIESKDNLRVAEIVRTCLAEYGYANRMDTAWGDPDLERFSEVYVNDNNAYWVAENEDGLVIAGVGVGPLCDETKTCELQKMYCVEAYRGTGIAQKLMDIALEFAVKHYKKCYLETLPSMERAKAFYEKNGFVHTTDTIGCTGHCACDYHYIRELGV